MPTTQSPAQPDLASAEDRLYQFTRAIVGATRTASVSQLQRRLGISYSHAGSLVERMVREGVITAANARGLRQDVQAALAPSHQVQALLDTLRAIVMETMDFSPARRYDESYLPGKLIEQAQAALAPFGAQVAPVLPSQPLEEVPA